MRKFKLSTFKSKISNGAYECVTDLKIGINDVRKLPSKKLFTIEIYDDTKVEKIEKTKVVKTPKAKATK